MGKGYVEVRIAAGVDYAELTALLSESGCLGGWEAPDALHLFWGLESWNPEILLEVDATLKRLGAGGEAPIEISEVEDRDWNAPWAASAQPILIGGRVLVRQSWNVAPVPSGGIELVIDPKRAFGSGFHATTQLLVEWLLDSIRGGERVLDAGTGSGILAMTALRLGAAAAVGIDCDPEAMECARENAAVNGFGPELELRVSGIAAGAGGTFDLVLANLDRNTLLQHPRELGRCLSPGGRMLATGIQCEDGTDVEAAFGAAGFRVTGRRERDEWLALELTAGWGHAPDLRRKG